MDIVESTGQFIKGLQNIERAIIERLRAAGAEATADNFQWHRGKEFVPPPEVISLEIRVRTKTGSAVLSREQIEDSWERIDRQDVIVLIEEMVAALV